MKPHMLENKNSWVGIGIMSVACVCVILFFVPALVHSALTSTNYTIEAPKVGSAGGTSMTSTNYSLSPRSGSTYTTSEIDTPEDGGTRTGSKNSEKPITEKPNIQPIISATIQSDAIKNEALNRIKNFQANTSSKNIVLKKEPENKIDDANASSTNGTKLEEDIPYIPANFASVISSNFTHFPARLVVLVWVLIFLYFIRTYTEFGKKNRPF